MPQTLSVLLFDSDGARRARVASALRARGFQASERSEPGGEATGLAEALAVVVDARLVGDGEFAAWLARPAEARPPAVGLLERPTVDSPRSFADVCLGPGESPEAIARVAAALIEARQANATLDLFRERQEELLRAVSHDLRSPLSTIQLQVQMLLRDASDPRKTQRRAESMLASSQRLNSMIQELVDFGRLEAGLLKLQRRPIDLRSRVDELKREPAGLSMERVRFSAPRELPALDADPARLDDILLALLGFGLGRSAPEAEVAFDAQELGGELALTVADEGPSLTREERLRLLERPARPKAFAGAAGQDAPDLYVARLLVEAHGGRLEVDGRPGGGVVLRAELPRAEAPVEAAQPSP